MNRPPAGPGKETVLGALRARCLLAGLHLAAVCFGLGQFGIRVLCKGRGGLRRFLGCAEVISRAGNGSIDLGHSVARFLRLAFVTVSGLFGVFQ